MELSFAQVNDADAARLAHELRLELLRAGVPAEAIRLKAGSDENMDLGSVVWANAELLAHMFGAAGYIACFGKCIYEVLHRNKGTIRISNEHGSVEIPSHAVTPDLIEKTLTTHIGKRKPLTSQRGKRKRAK